MPPLTAESRELTKDSTHYVAQLRVNAEERRRQQVGQDPSLLFGTALFAQMVASDLARNTVAPQPIDDEVTEAGDESDVTSALAEQGQGLLGLSGGLASVAPLGAAVAVLTGVPSSGGNNGLTIRPVEPQPEAQTPPADEPESAQNSSFLGRSVSGFQSGQRPQPEGAADADPMAEAAAAQATAAEAPQQFASAGGGTPFVVSPTAPVVEAAATRFSARPDADDAQNAAGNAPASTASSRTSTRGADLDALLGDVQAPVVSALSSSASVSETLMNGVVGIERLATT